MVSTVTVSKYVVICRRSMRTARTISPFLKASRGFVLAFQFFQQESDVLTKVPDCFKPFLVF